MTSRWYSIAVVLLWLASMTWLVATKVVPPMLIGEPPSYRTIIQSQADQPPVGWRLLAGNQEAGRRQTMGWALSSVNRLPNDTTEVRSLVHFDHVPLEQLIPPWIRKLLLGYDSSGSGLEMESESLLLVDPLWNLTSFDAVLRLKPLQLVLKMGGTVKGSRMEITLQAGADTYPPVMVPLPEKALVGDALSPQTRLKDLRIGQTWQVPSYSFLRLNDPVEYLHATVVELTPLVWNENTEKTWLVEYRSDPARGPRGKKGVRGRLWVRRDDGTVLQQQVILSQAELTFVRMPDEEAAALHEKQAKERKQHD